MYQIKFKNQINVFVFLHLNFAFVFKKKTIFSIHNIIKHIKNILYYFTNCRCIICSIIFKVLKNALFYNFLLIVQKNFKNKFKRNWL